MSAVPKVGDVVRLSAGSALYRVICVYTRGSVSVADIVRPNGQSYTRRTDDLVVVDPVCVTGLDWADVPQPKIRPTTQCDAVAVAESALEAAKARLRMARAEAAAVKKAKAEEAKAEAARQAVIGRLHDHMMLAKATFGLLQRITLATNGSEYTEPDATYAAFRKALSPLAESYGYRLVLVGDNTRAVLTKL